MNTRYGTDVHNQPKIYIENPAESSHISPYICQLIYLTNYGARIKKLFIIEIYEYGEIN